MYAYDPRIDAETRTLLIRALCPNPGGALLPGAFANVELTLGETRDALLVPAEALIPDFEATYVFVVKDGKAERRRVADRHAHGEARADPVGPRRRATSS